MTKPKIVYFSVMILGHLLAGAGPASHRVKIKLLCQAFQSLLHLLLHFPLFSSPPLSKSSPFLPCCILREHFFAPSSSCWHKRFKFLRLVCLVLRFILSRVVVRLPRTDGSGILWLALCWLLSFTVGVFFCGLLFPLCTVFNWEAGVGDGDHHLSLCFHSRPALGF